VRAAARAPKVEVFEAALRARCFRVEKLAKGARRVTFIGEHVSKNIEVDALVAVEALGRSAGLDVGLEVSGRGALLWINPIDPPPQDEATNDIGHPIGHDCPVCLPEKYDPAELEAGRGEKTAG